MYRGPATVDLIFPAVSVQPGANDPPSPMRTTAGQLEVTGEGKVICGTGGVWFQNSITSVLIFLAFPLIGSAVRC